ncbi:hypothetical protein [Oryza sativa Japonica Group]|uniref:Uncharacterized protein n=1 Tax=Oryza sativa subsp. japonica TaxID=39947 RepID=Q5ZBP5_ORYSJ|nr:hypothetical protein OsJ_02554 [Oryza sativa Japonica Group]BAD52828.1 hypothetical protein [Oryza sativa Japonica Group]BAD53059.1 hypothetical protein [Oryza sativa Japonica Group]
MGRREVHHGRLQHEHDHAYLTQQLDLPLVEASNLITNFTGTADSFAGRLLWTIAAGGVLSQLGMLGLVVSALVPTLCPAPCGAATAAAS